MADSSRRRGRASFAPRFVPPRGPQIAIADPRGIENLRSDTHSLSVEKKGGNTLVSAKPKGDSKELLLRYRPKVAPYQLSAFVHKDPNHPRLPEPIDGHPPRMRHRKTRTYKDLTLVLDRSGSMSGEPLKNAKKAAAELITKLSENDRVNVILFDDGVESLYSAPKVVDAEVRSEALAYVAAVSDGGGTDNRDGSLEGARASGKRRSSQCSTFSHGWAVRCAGCGQSRKERSLRRAALYHRSRKRCGESAPLTTRKGKNVGALCSSRVRGRSLSG